MPTYEYACEACGHQFEEFQSIKADPIQKCPKCGKKKVKRLISGGAGFLFKGSGFYITDYRSDSYKSDAKADNGGGAAKTDAAPAKSDTPAKSGAPAATPAPAPAKPESAPVAKPSKK
jgi:putative FmdB family regulatory protein